MKHRPEVEERKLFREAVSDVRPLDHGKQVPAAPPRAPTARYTRRYRQVALTERLDAAAESVALGPGDELVFRREGVQSAVLRKLRRGHFRVEGELDLHGLTVAEAQQALLEFLADALALGARCVRVIHGKGLRSGDRGPVLKSAVNAILRRTGEVIAFVSAPQADGGTGAVYVLLSKTTA